MSISVKAKKKKKYTKLEAPKRAQKRIQSFVSAYGRSW